MMLFNELISKYKTTVKNEHKRYEDMGSVELTDTQFESEPYKTILFQFEIGVKHYRVETMEGLKALPKKMIEDIKGRGRPYAKLGVSGNYRNLKTSAYLLVHNSDRFLDYMNNKYHFNGHFTEIVRLELNQKYMGNIDCSVIALYRDGTITFDQMVESTKKC